jgi:hypothetical protein
MSRLDPGCPAARARTQGDLQGKREEDDSNDCQSSSSTVTADRGSRALVASRLSGTQNAASSFSLNSGNTSPKDIVTDGVNLWVVNDSSTDKVFKYALSGSLVGSWTISGAGSAPTGITLDPAHVGNLWIVDSGTKRVYQFDNAASLISGNLYPSTSFTLAASNTNPQGIADSPAGVPIPAALTSAPMSTASPPVRGHVVVEDNCPTLAAVPFMHPSAFDQALDTFHPVAPQESGLDLLFPELLRARRRRWS